MDSDEEAYLASLSTSALQKKLSERKKSSQNNAILPRTATALAGQPGRTTVDMKKALKKAGYDTSKLEAHIKSARASAGEKRKRDDEGMDVDEEGGWEDENGSGEGDDGMDVDGDGGLGAKKSRTNEGGVVLKSNRKPFTNRQMAGFKDSEVSHASLVFARSTLIARADGSISLLSITRTILLPTYSKLREPSNCGISANAIVTIMPRLESPIVPSGQRW